MDQDGIAAIEINVAMPFNKHATLPVCYDLDHLEQVIREVSLKMMSRNLQSTSKKHPAIGLKLGPYLDYRLASAVANLIQTLNKHSAGVQTISFVV
jgi:hypothetical protein